MMLRNLTDNIRVFSTKQIETLFWAVYKSKVFLSKEEDTIEKKEALDSLLLAVQQKSASMKGRSLAFVAEGLE
jgi:hypothetical protein